MPNRQPITQARAQRIVDSYKLIKALAKMIEYEHASDFDADFKSPIIHQHVSRIKESSIAIYNATGKLLMTAKGADEAGAEYTANLLRLLKFAEGNMNPAVLQAFVDGLEKMDRTELTNQTV